MKNGKQKISFYTEEVDTTFEILQVINKIGTGKQYNLEQIDKLFLEDLGQSGNIVEKADFGAASNDKRKDGALDSHTMAKVSSEEEQILQYFVISQMESEPSRLRLRLMMLYNIPFCMHYQQKENIR